MVGLVLVSHSSKVAEGAREMASQISASDTPIAAVGGTKDGRLGTDADQIVSAIESVYSDDGVLLLYDLGSALMSADVALEYLQASDKTNIKIVHAPLIEGAVIAAVEISVGKGLDEIKAELEGMGADKQKWGQA